MEHGQSGEQDYGWNPEMNIGEDHGPHAAGFLRGFFVKQAFAPRTQREKRCA
jgi:hypothetical protein